MASTQLADVYVPLTFRQLIQEAQTETNAFINSGIAMRDPLIDQQFANGGRTGELPQYNGITIKEPNYSSDDPGSDAVPGKISDSLQKLRSASRNDHWSTMDFARELALKDPEEAITGRIGAFWSTDDEHRIINSLSGVKADNVANDGSDMIYSVANDDVIPGGGIPAEDAISADAIAEAAQTMGDHKSKLTAIAMHSRQETTLASLKLLEVGRDASGVALGFNTYRGFRVVVDDSLVAVSAGSNRVIYTAILFSAGAIGWGMGKVQNPTALSRNELAGDGGGESIISSRVNTIYHPNGFSFNSTSITGGEAANYADLKNAVNWTRTVNRKSVGIAFLESNA